MISSIRKSELLGYNRLVEDSALIKKASIGSIVFLSHSHQDATLVEAARKFFMRHGGNIYVDWKDNSMPSITSPETAKKIQARIVRSNKFVLLVTDNALNSAWVPWELGFSNGAKGFGDIAVFSVSDDYGNFKGREYLGIYSTIKETTDNDWAVFEPGSTKGSRLRHWLANNRL